MLDKLAKTIHNFTMTTINRDEVLAQMGITRWVLRDAGAGMESKARADKELALENTLEAQPPVSASVPPEVQDNAPVQAAQVESSDLVEMPDPVLVTPVDVESLQALSVQVQNCTVCSLAQSRTQTVFGIGPERSDWLFVGEAPGQQEDRQGKPFVGRAGSLLTQMLLALGQSREQVYITNTLKCHPPVNRDPLPEELQACEPFLLKQIEFLQPKVIIALGQFSAQTLLKLELPLKEMRGQVYRYGVQDIPLVVTYHPAYLLRNPADKAKVWQDLLLANRQMAG